MPSVHSEQDIRRVVIIGTGGTIAGTSASTARHIGYQAGVLGAQALVAAVPALQGQALETISLVQMDSCDMDHATWLRLHAAVAGQLARADVAGVVVTHGTDTLEETAYFLHRTLVAAKPVVLTAAMRPATAPSPDGPQNLLDAVAVARADGACGVVAVLAGRVHAAADLRKLHGYRVDAFDSGDAGPLAVLEDGALRVFRSWPCGPLHAASARLLALPAGAWPLVDIVTSHAGARARGLDGLVAAGAAGIVIAGTGNGSVHAALRSAALRAQAAGVVVWRASRCPLGGVVADVHTVDPLPSSGALTAVQARIELMLNLAVAAADPNRALDTTATATATAIESPAGPGRPPSG